MKCEHCGQEIPEDKDALFPFSVKEKDWMTRAIKETLYPYYIKTNNKPSFANPLTPERLKRGRLRLAECFKARKDMKEAIEMFELAIEGLAASDFHQARGKYAGKKKYNAWIENLCRSSEKFSEWVEEGMRESRCG